MTPTKSKTLLGDLRRLIAEARQGVARQVNSALALLYWRVGQRIRQDILKEKRAEYGEEIVATLSQQLTEEYGSGWSRHNLARMIQFAELFPDQNIVATLSQQLGWSHFKEIIPLDDDLSGTSTLRCAGSNTGACVPFAGRLPACSSSARHCRRNPRN